MEGLAPTRLANIDEGKSLVMVLWNVILFLEHLTILVNFQSKKEKEGENMTPFKIYIYFY